MIVFACTVTIFIMSNLLKMVTSSIMYINVTRFYSKSFSTVSVGPFVMMFAPM